MQIVFVQFYSILPFIQNSHVRRCTRLLALNILPYNISQISDQEILFYTQDRTLYNEMLPNKTRDQLVSMVHVIFNYTFSHLSDTL